MAGTFLCPFCQASYPIKPVLVGRQVRCSSCKKIFVLGANGIATGVEEAPAKETVASQSSPPQPPPPPPPGDSPAPATGGPRRGPSSSRLTERQQQIRSSMAASLSEVASKALKSETIKREAERTKTERRRKQYRQDAEHGVGNIKPALLTDYGAQEAKNARHWFAIGGAIAVLILLILYFSTFESAPRATLSALMRPVEGRDWAAPHRERTVQARTWLPNQALPLVTNANTARISSARHVSLAPLSQVLDGELSQHLYLSGPELWVPTGDSERSLEIWRQRQWNTQAELIRALAQQRIPAINRSGLSKQLTAAGLSEQGLEIVESLLYQEGAWAGAWMRDGRLPTQASIRNFNGRDGRRLVLVNLQRGYRTQEGVAYSGRLLRLSGGNWRGEAPDGRSADAWRVWDMTITGGEDGLFLPR